MNFPAVERLETPILQELAATGGAEDVRFLYDRLIRYFPQLDKTIINNGKLEKWRLYVQRAGRELDQTGLICRERGLWTLTTAGQKRAALENSEFFLVEKNECATTENPHLDLQNKLCEIGWLLGFYAEIEFEYYDVVWRTHQSSPRLSHVFEVQRKGNIDSAFAKLKKSFDAQRSKTFLIIDSETDTNRARRSLSPAQSGAFHELEGETVILSFAQIENLHRSLHSVADVLPHFLTK